MTVKHRPDSSPNAHHNIHPLSSHISALLPQELAVEQRSLQLASVILEVQEQIGHLKGVGGKEELNRCYYPESVHDAIELWRIYYARS